MRILHTADWHIGQTLNSWSREHEHRVFLESLRDLILSERVDALLVAGDARGLHRMVELIDAGSDAFDEVASGLGQLDAACMSLKQKNAKVFLQRLHARADTGLRYAERVGGVAKVQIFRDGEGLDQR